LTKPVAEPFAELKFGLSPDLSHKVKWFRWAKRSKYRLRPKLSWTLV